MNILSLITDSRVGTILRSFNTDSVGGEAVDKALDLGVKIAPAISALAVRDISTIDSDFLNGLAASAGFDLAGAAGPIAELLKTESAGFEGTLLSFLRSERGLQFLRRFAAGGRSPQPTQCPECGHITF